MSIDQNPFANLYHLFPEDIDALLGLGVTDLPTDFPHNAWVKVATIHTEEPEGPRPIDISVSMLPAKFWSFEWNSHEGSRMRMTTGSGRLTKYLPLALMAVDEMFTVEVLETSSAIDHLPEANHG